MARVKTAIKTTVILMVLKVSICASSMAAPLPPATTSDIERLAASVDAGVELLPEYCRPFAAASSGQNVPANADSGVAVAIAASHIVLAEKMRQTGDMLGAAFQYAAARGALSKARILLAKQKGQS